MASVPSKAQSAEDAEQAPRQPSRLRGLFGWLLHLQNMVLLAYLSWVMFDPKNLGLLSAFYVLPPLWLASVLLGVWCLWCARDRSTLLLAVWGGSATVLMLNFQGRLNQAELLPVADGATAQLILVVGLFTYPLVLFGRLLLWLTKPRANVALQPGAGAPLRTRVLGILVTLLAALALLLAGNLLVGGSWLGKGTFEPWLNVGLTVSLATAFIAGPYALLSMLRRSLPLGISMWILAALVTTALCYFAIFVYIAIHSGG